MILDSRYMPDQPGDRIGVDVRTEGQAPWVESFHGSVDELVNPDVGVNQDIVREQCVLRLVQRSARR